MPKQWTNFRLLKMVKVLALLFKYVKKSMVLSILGRELEITYFWVKMAHSEILFRELCYVCSSSRAYYLWFSKRIPRSGELDDDDSFVCFISQIKCQNDYIVLWKRMHIQDYIYGMEWREFDKRKTTRSPPPPQSYLIISSI